MKRNSLLSRIVGFVRAGIRPSTTAGPCGVSRDVPCGCWRGSVVRDDLKHIGVESYWCKMHSDDSLRRATELDDRTLIERPTSPRSAGLDPVAFGVTRTLANVGVAHLLVCDRKRSDDRRQPHARSSVRLSCAIR